MGTYECREHYRRPEGTACTRGLALDRALPIVFSDLAWKTLVELKGEARDQANAALLAIVEDGVNAPKGVAVDHWGRYQIALPGSNFLAYDLVREAQDGLDVEPPFVLVYPIIEYQEPQDDPGGII